MPSYHPKKSNPSLIFMLGGDEDDYIVIDIDIDVNMAVGMVVEVDMDVCMNTDVNVVPDTRIDKYKIKSLQFINNFLLFIKTIFLF